MGLFSKFFLTSPLSLGDWFFSISGSGFVEMFVAALVRWVRLGRRALHNKDILGYWAVLACGVRPRAG
jgi:ATP-dependent Zn protease